MLIPISGEHNEDVKNKKVEYLKFKSIKIPLTEQEIEILEKAYQTHVEKYGLSYGFVINNVTLFNREDE